MREFWYNRQLASFITCANENAKIKEKETGKKIIIQLNEADQLNKPKCKAAVPVPFTNTPPH